MLKPFLLYFKGTLIASGLGLMIAAGIGFYSSGELSGALHALFICLILGILETSLSFDNAVINATVLKQMSPVWQRRFLTWGMIIAVFGMRLIFPVMIVAVIGKMGPIEALQLALLKPLEYAQMMLSAEHEISAFGGAFLLLVSLKYFFDQEKTLHWIRFIEKPLFKLGKLEALEFAITIVVILLISQTIPSSERNGFLYSGLAGVLSFLCLEGVNLLFRKSSKKPARNSSELSKKDIHRASLGLFLYLEILDASFSFDGVIGAFAITPNLFIIAIGLGIGALFVRSLTIMMVEKGSLNTFVFLEHGAFYALGALAIIMFLNVLTQVPEVVSGLIGAFFISLATWSSIRHKRLLQS